MNYALFISCPKGLEYLLEEEVKALGLKVTQVSPQGVFGEASLSTIYHLCLWSRIANRIQYLLFSGEAHNESSLYKLCNLFPWHTVFSVDKSIAVEFHGTAGQIRNTMFGAQVVKDAIVDYFRKLTGKRPTVNKEEPQLLIHAHLKQEVLTVSLDLVGYSLHQRGYRALAGGAPLKENIAAAILMRARWPLLAAKGYAFYDPFCGSGTLVIEAAMMASKVAPGLLRQDQALSHWLMHQASLWEKIRVQALQQIKPFTGAIIGSDCNARMTDIAKANAEKAGVGKLVHFETKSISECSTIHEKGLLVCNPPYGERQGEELPLIPIYQQIGEVLAHQFKDWEAAVLTSNTLLAKAIGLKSHKQYAIFNGPIECKLYCITVLNNRYKQTSEGEFSKSAQMFANRLQKNITHLQKWAKKNQISCYRVYDADLPEYAYAIDIYNNFAVLQEYKAPLSIEAHKVERRTLEVLQVVPQILKIPNDHLVLKQRKQQKGTEQYTQLRKTHRTIVVEENLVKFKVNLFDYIDTGLFFDYRLLRSTFKALPKGTQFLNCFCYTATASVCAALAGAITTNIDLSNTYLSWAQENFKLNHVDTKQHHFIKADCTRWLKTSKERFDVIFLDPPSFSNSKGMEDTLDIQRDHEQLISTTMRLLKAQGVLYFSTNLRNFKLSPFIQSHFEVKNITQATIDIDFKRNVKIHHCFEIRKASQVTGAKL